MLCLISPERLLKAKMLQALYTIRPENLLIEALEYNLLFRWFLDFNLLDPVWDHATFTKNQERLLRHQAAELFFLPASSDWPASTAGRATRTSRWTARSSTRGPA